MTMLAAVEQYVLQPRLHRRADRADVGECHLAGEAIVYVRGETNMNAERFRRTLFHPGAHDQEAGAIERHTSTLGKAASRDRYGFCRSLTRA